ncbi:MAG: mechanosensitive ion channel family protein [Candidatus Gracilibacteria bacterium]
MLQELVANMVSIITFGAIIQIVIVVIVSQIVLVFIKKPSGRLFGMAKFLVWSIAFVLILSNLGYNVSSLIAGLGIGGIALALAAQETLSNAFASLSILADKPFKTGDSIKVGDHTGKVISIGIRSTRIETASGTTVSIPNKLVASLPIENLSH